MESKSAINGFNCTIPTYNIERSFCIGFLYIFILDLFHHQTTNKAIRRQNQITYDTYTTNTNGLEPLRGSVVLEQIEDGFESRAAWE